MLLCCAGTLRPEGGARVMEETGLDCQLTLSILAVNLPRTTIILHCTDCHFSVCILTLYSHTLLLLFVSYDVHDIYCS